jgi:hypothetical protein
MIGFALTTALFLFWGLIGYAVVRTVHPWRPLLENLLVAPVVGVATSVLLVFLLNRAGLPVQSYGAGLAGALLIAGSVQAWRFRVRPDVAMCLSFAGVLAVAMFLTGRPMLDFNLAWLSYVNDDMTNYVLGAERFLRHGFAETPDPDTLIKGRDYSQFFWFFFVAGIVRPGSELLLAWVQSFTGLTGHQVFMPTMLALHLGLIAATGAMTHRFRPSARAALVACALMGGSALSTLGVLYQLIAQVAGLGLLVAAVLLAMPTAPEPTARRALRLGALVGIVATALLIVYPEVFPFFGAALLLYIMYVLVRQRCLLATLWRSWAASGLTGLLLLNTYVPIALVFLLIQVGSGTRASDVEVSLFPYFLLPSGFADLWGLQNMFVLSKDPELSRTIQAGAFMLVLSTLIAVRRSFSGLPPAMVVLVMLAIAVRFFTGRLDFALFKLAMFVQPFLLGMLVIEAWRRRWDARLLLVPLIGVSIYGLTGQSGYVARSRGNYNEVPFASSGDIAAEFRNLVEARPGQDLILGTTNVVLAKLEVAYTAGRSANLPSRDFFYPIVRAISSFLPDKSITSTGLVLLNDVEQEMPMEHFNMVGAVDEGPLTDMFRVNGLGAPRTSSCPVLIRESGRQTVFNRWHDQGASADANFRVWDCHTVQNQLVFVHSELGQNYYQFGEIYYGTSRPRVAYYQLELDPMEPGRSMTGIGRYLLFRVLNPTPRVRVVLDVTASMRADGVNKLPLASAIGANREPFVATGRGAARLFSPPIEPQQLPSGQYLAIDMGEDGRRFPEERLGLMALYGTDVPMDRRELVGFARDISVISEDEYTRLRPPSAIATFPDDLNQPSLEYSGLYEDGWTGEDAYAVLQQPPDSQALQLRGMLPLVTSEYRGTAISVLVDGHEVANNWVDQGEFTMCVPIEPADRRRRVELRFAQPQQFPVGDSRPVGALLRYVGFADAGTTCAPLPNSAQVVGPPQ